MRVVGHHTVYKDERYYCGPGPSVVCGEEGELLVAFRRVRSWLGVGHAGHWHPATELCLTRSVDGGQSWSAPQVFLGGYQCPCLTRLRAGALILSTHRPSAAMCSKLARDGSWLRPIPLASRIAPISSHRPMVVARGVWSGRSRQILTRPICMRWTRGNCWPLCAAGAIASFCTAVYRGMAGQTWSEPAALCRGYPACAVAVPAGIFIAYGYRFEPAYGVRARLLSPVGELVDEEELVLCGDGAVADLGYPHACLLPDGRVAVVYYANSKRDAGDGNAPRYIELALVEVQ